MTVGQLIDRLEGLDADTQVRFASQPKWPFEYSIGDVVTVETGHNICNDDVTEIVYLSEGRQIGYLPSEAKDELGW